MFKSISAQFDHQRKTSMLYFDDHDPMECSMRGGICWPILYEYKGLFETHGYAIMAGLEIATGIVHVFEERQWVTIDNIVQDNQIRYLGLSHWFNRVWKDYFAQKFYFHQPHELSKQFRLQISRSVMVAPKPKFHELGPLDTQDYISTIQRAIMAERLQFAQGKPLQKQLELVKAGDKQMLPAVHALGCCLVGMERFQWRPPFEKTGKEVLMR